MRLSILRHTALALTRRAGVDRLLARSAWRQRRLLILCYHGIASRDEHEWKPALYFELGAFRRRMELLCAEGANVLPLGEALDRLHGGTLPPRSVAITFDDGMVDFHRLALPVLQALGLRTTLYLTTYYMQRQWPVFDLAASYFLWLRREASLDAWPTIASTSSLPLATSSQRQVVMDRLRHHATAAGMGGRQKCDLLQELAEHLEIDYAAFARSRHLCIMNEAEVREVAAAGVEVELHTHRHRSPACREQFLDELAKNGAIIRDVTGRKPEHFCFPSGVYLRTQLPWLREAGIRSATTCEPALATTASDPLLLPRFVDTQAQPEPTYQSWLAGTASLIRARR